MSGISFPWFTSLVQTLIGDDFGVGHFLIGEAVDGCGGFFQRGVIGIGDQAGVGVGAAAGFACAVGIQVDEPQEFVFIGHLYLLEMM